MRFFLFSLFLQVKDLRERSEEEKTGREIIDWFRLLVIDLSSNLLQKELRYLGEERERESELLHGICHSHKDFIFSCQVLTFARIVPTENCESTRLD